jgi:hypothetical protein
MTLFHVELRMSCFCTENEGSFEHRGYGNQKFELKQHGSRLNYSNKNELNVNSYSVCL